MTIIATGVLLGILFAEYLNRAVILPGLRLPDSSVLPPSDLYDIKSLGDVMNKHNITMLMPLLPQVNSSVQVASCEGIDELSPVCMEKIKGQFHGVKDVAFECPYPHSSVSPSFVREKQALYWELVGALIPSKKLGNKLNDLEHSISETFNTTVHGFLQASRTAVDLDHSLEYNSMRSSLNLVLSGPTLNLGERNGCRAMTVEELGQPLGELNQPERDLISFYTALGSEKTLSDSGSAWGALILLERREKLLYAAHYPGGNPIIISRIPLMRLPWVFFHNTEDENMEYMLKVAVKSGVMSKSLTPYCVLTGPHSEIHAWLAKNNVTTISHNSSWVSNYLENEEKARKKAAQFKLGRDMEKISIGNALQIEIPNIEQLRQFQYVLYTAPYVFFRQKVTLVSFGKEPPRVVKCISESADKFPFASTIVLWNVSAGVLNYRNMVQYVEDPHRTRKPLEFIVGEERWTLSNNQLKWVSSQRLATRSVEGYDPLAAIVDFSGMSPHNFVRQVRQANCPDNICLEGIFRGWCHYIFDWSNFLESDDAEAGINVMKECVRRLCGLRGGCRRWKDAISRIS